MASNNRTSYFKSSVITSHDSLDSTITFVDITWMNKLKCNSRDDKKRIVKTRLKIIDFTQAKVLDYIRTYTTVTMYITI